MALALPALQLTLVKDITLNATNDYMLFGESFEKVAKIGAIGTIMTTTART